MEDLIPRLPLDRLTPELRKAMDHTQSHVIIFDLAINCESGGVLSDIEARNAVYLEWKKLNPDFDDSCPF